MIGKDELEVRFAHHPPANEEASRLHESIRSACLGLAEYLDSVLQDGREKSLAITNLEQTMFWANAGIARRRE